MHSGWQRADVLPKARLSLTQATKLKLIPSRLFWACNPQHQLQPSTPTQWRSLLRSTWRPGLLARETLVNCDRRFSSLTPTWRISICWNQKWISSVLGSHCPSMESVCLWWDSTERRRRNCWESAPTGSWGWLCPRGIIWKLGDIQPWKPGTSTGRQSTWWSSLKTIRMSFSR